MLHGGLLETGARGAKHLYYLSTRVGLCQRLGAPTSNEYTNVSAYVKWNSY